MADQINQNNSNKIKTFNIADFRTIQDLGEIYQEDDFLDSKDIALQPIILDDNIDDRKNYIRDGSQFTFQHRNSNN